MMMSNSNTPSYSSQSSESDHSPVPSNVVHYGPIQVRLCRKIAPTLSTGRRSKHMTLHGEEAAKREKRREKNRIAAKKLKEKRQFIENELNKEIEELENEHSDLQNYLARLRQQKQHLEFELQRIFSQPVEYLFNNEQEMSAFFDQYLGEFDLEDDYIETLFDL